MHHCLSLAKFGRTSKIHATSIYDLILAIGLFLARK